MNSDTFVLAHTSICRSPLCQIHAISYLCPWGQRENCEQPKLRIVKKKKKKDKSHEVQKACDTSVIIHNHNSDVVCDNTVVLEGPVLM